MEMKEVVVIRGCVDAGISNAPPGSYGRKFEHLRLYTVGQTVSLPESEAKRLAALGIVEPVKC